MITIGPKPIDICVINADKCPLNNLLSCIILNEWRQYVELKQEKAIDLISGPHYVRGVNSSFYLIKLDNKNYYINEQYLNKKV